MAPVPKSLTAGIFPFLFLITFFSKRVWGLIWALFQGVQIDDLGFGSERVKIVSAQFRNFLYYIPHFRSHFPAGARFLTFHSFSGISPPLSASSDASFFFLFCFRFYLMKLHNPIILAIPAKKCNLRRLFIRVNSYQCQTATHAGILSQFGKQNRRR